jgi:hypothetical protein
MPGSVHRKVSAHRHGRPVEEALDPYGVHQVLDQGEAHSAPVSVCLLALPGSVVADRDRHGVVGDRSVARVTLEIPNPAYLVMLT